MSFKNAEIGFAGLNVLVGPNGAGKTNLLKLFRFLGETARTDLVPALEAFGGISNILFAGERSSEQIRILIEATITKHSHEAASDSYELKFRQRRLARHVSSISYIERNEKFVFKRLMGPGRRITLKGGNISVTSDRASQSRADSDDDLKIKVQPQSAGLSTLRRLGKDVEASQVDELASLFESIRVFDVGVSGARLPSGGEMSSRLSNDARNIASYLAWLKATHEEIFEVLIDDLKQVVPGLQAMHVEMRGDAYYVELEEAGLRKRTALPQASFGTIRSSALFAMLHDPSPPKLTCVEEIDHGLHPYALDVLVDRMRAAALRTQLVVATHSPALVNRLRPEELIVFERDQSTGETRIPKIDPASLSEMEQSSGLQLGELWFSGTLGGVP